MENIETLNERLKHFFGLFENGEPNWRLTWTTNELETRFGHFEDRTESDIYIRTAEEFRTVKKYEECFMDQWVLERLIPVENNKELTVKISYEPIWFFEKEQHPDWDVCKLLIEQLYRQANEHFNGPKYEAPLEDQNTKEGVEARAKIYEKLLFPDAAASIQKKLAYDEAVIVPNKQFEGTIIGSN